MCKMKIKRFSCRFIECLTLYLDELCTYRAIEDSQPSYPIYPVFN